MPIRMYMSRSDYVAIAQALNLVKRMYNQPVSADTLRVYQPVSADEIIFVTARELSRIFESLNPNFNPATFAHIVENGD